MEHEDKLESYLIYSFASAYYDTPEWLELSLQCILESKDLKRFWPFFLIYAGTHSPLPVHYQEAAILYASRERNVEISKLIFDNVILNNFQEFAKMTYQYPPGSNIKDQSFYFSRFSNTYWYYYYFLE